METDIITIICEGDLDKVKSLITSQNINTKNEDGFTPLHLAVLYSKVDIVKFLVSQGADTNAQRNDNTSILHTANSFHNSEIIKSLVDAGATVDTGATVDERYEQEKEQERKRRESLEPYYLNNFSS